MRGSATLTSAGSDPAIKLLYRGCDMFSSPALYIDKIFLSNYALLLVLMLLLAIIYIIKLVIK